MIYAHFVLSLFIGWFSHVFLFTSAKVNELGLRTAYTRQIVVRSQIRQLMALPNLPAEHIPPAFEKLKASCGHSPQLTALTKYLSKTWVFSISRPPASWTTFKKSVRTNNDAEGWHHRLNKRALHDHMNIYLLVMLLHKEALLLPLQVRLRYERNVV